MTPKVKNFDDLDNELSYEGTVSTTFVLKSAVGVIHVQLRPITRIALSTTSYLLFLFIYSLNKYVPILPRAEDVLCARLYNISAVESTIFGFSPYQLISSHSSPALDVLAAMPYLLHYALPVLFPLYLYWRNNTAASQVEDICSFYRLLGWSMWAHYVIWFVMPTAPPWYYEALGEHSGEDESIQSLLRHREGCAFARLDALANIPFFVNLFGGNPIPFASFPSGHVAWPTCIYMINPPCGRLFIAYIFWVVWATLYSCHHYLLDAVAAICVVVAVKFVQNIKFFVWSAPNVQVYQGENRTSKFLSSTPICPLSIV